MLSATLIFFAVFALDVVWAWYTAALVARRILSASACAAGIIALSGINTLGFVHNPWMLLPAMAGAFCGTAFGMRHGAGAP